MYLNAIILFLSAFIGGLFVLRMKDPEKIKIREILVFAGAFLFSITVLHILPELFQSTADPFYVGLFILIGFFFQQVLEYFTHGVEHGHTHIHRHDNDHTSWSGLSLMVALCLHAFLEGTLLAHPSAIHASHSQGTLLAGIVLHKIPAALALMTVLSCQFKSRNTQVILLLIFALASPFGLVAGHYIEATRFFGHAGLVMLFAFVAGNFLHISTTIFIESSPEHRWNTKKLLISVLGAVVAVIAELFT